MPTLEEQFEERLRKMSRHSVSEAERISKEAEKAAGQLAKKLLDDKHPFQSAIKAISNKATLTILLAEEAAKWVDKARSQTLTLAKRIPSIVALPTLLQVATGYYYRPNHEKLRRNCLGSGQP